MHTDIAMVVWKALDDLRQAVKKRLSGSHSDIEPQGPEPFSSAADENSRRGRRVKPEAQGKVAALGLSQGSISMAQRHVAAVERYPELGGSDLSR